MMIYSFLAFFVLKVLPLALDLFDEEQNGNGAFNALVTKYELQGSFQRSVLHTQSFNDRLGDGEDPDVFIARLEDKQRRLQAFDKTVDDETLKDFARAKLAREYDTFTAIIDSYKTITCDNFKEQLRAFYLRHVASETSSDKTQGSALNTQTSMGGSYQPNDQPRYDGKNKKKSYRGRGGRGFMGRRGRGGYGGGRGHFNPNVICYTCKEKGHY